MILVITEALTVPQALSLQSWSKSYLEALRDSALSLVVSFPLVLSLSWFLLLRLRAVFWFAERGVGAAWVSSLLHSSHKPLALDETAAELASNILKSEYQAPAAEKHGLRAILNHVADSSATGTAFLEANDLIIRAPFCMAHLLVKPASSYHPPMLHRAEWCTMCAYLSSGGASPRTAIISSCLRVYACSPPSRQFEDLPVLADAQGHHMAGVRLPGQPLVHHPGHRSEAPRVQCDTM